MPRENRETGSLSKTEMARPVETEFCVGFEKRCVSQRSCVGHIGAHARECAGKEVPPFFVSREHLNGWCRIWCLVRDQLAIRVSHINTQAKGKVHPHVRTCVPVFHISRTGTEYRDGSVFDSLP